MHSNLMRATMGALVVGALAAAGCSSSSSDPAPADTGAKAQTLYDKYGGAPTVKKVVDDAVAGVLADPKEAPFFTVIGTPGHDSVDRLKGCLVLQFTALLGGPATYPGKNANGDMCEDMTTAHKDLGIPSDVFDQFITDLAGVLKKDGVSDEDIGKVAPALVGMKPMIVTK
ncbi:MAG: hypothetical protein NVS3B10_22440 [Polyangiales bacterium]